MLKEQIISAVLVVFLNNGFFLVYTHLGVGGKVGLGALFPMSPRGQVRNGHNRETWACFLASAWK